MKVGRFLELLKEYEGGDRLGFAGRYDDSGVRFNGADRRPRGRGGNYPYDRDVFYGKPTAYDRGSNASGPLDGNLIPKDDRHFSLRTLGIEDDEIDEISGSPINMSRGTSSQRGSSVPGAAGGWAVDPPKDWDEDDGDIDYGHEGDVDEDFEVIVPGIDDGHEESYRDFLRSLDPIDRPSGGEIDLVDPEAFGKPDAHVIGPDPWGAFNNRMTSRGLYGLMPKESAWDRMRGLSLKKDDSEERA
jgi:hypothetical protein